MAVVGHASLSITPDLPALHRVADSNLRLELVPGWEAGTGTVVVSLSGVEPGLGPDAADLVWGPADVVAAWS